MALSPVRLKSSSMKSSATSQKYSWPGREQNQAIHVREDVGVEDAGEGDDELIIIGNGNTRYRIPRPAADVRLACGDPAAAVAENCG
jgi:hypothetical protein